MEALYYRLGGEPALVALSGIMYQRFKKDPLISPFFKDVDFETQEKKMIITMAHVFGGPQMTVDVDLREVHKPLVEKGLGDAHFNAVVSHIIEILKEMHVCEIDIEDAVSKLAVFKEDVLNR